MDKLSAKQARARTQAKADGIAKSSRTIAKAFPRSVSAEGIAEFTRQATAAVKTYLGLLPVGKPKRRPHRASHGKENRSGGHRPDDPHRHGLIGDLYDAYMGVRGDDPNLRGFAAVADAALRAANLPEVTEREQRRISEQIKKFDAFA